MSETWRVLLGLSIFIKFYEQFRVYFVLFSFRLFLQTCFWELSLQTDVIYTKNLVRKCKDTANIGDTNLVYSPHPINVTIRVLNNRKVCFRLIHIFGYISI